MMKMIYSQIFHFLIDSINKKSSYLSPEQIIGILDIPGFGALKTIYYVNFIVILI